MRVMSYERNFKSTGQYRLSYFIAVKLAFKQNEVSGYSTSLKATLK